MKLTLTIFILILSNYLTAQTSKLKIAISANQLNVKDTFSMEIMYTTKDGVPKNGTLYLKMINNEGITWNYRWPIYKGICMPKLVIANDAKQGQYHLYFATRDEQFGINGLVENVKEVSKLNAIISNQQSLIVTSDIAIEKAGQFYYTNPYFVNQALLKFLNKNKKGDKPVLKITSILDSTFTPTANAGVNINIGEPREETLEFDLPESYTEASEIKRKDIKVEKMVIVTAKKPSLAKQYEEKYISELFKSGDATLLDVMTDDPGKYGTSAINYLLNNVTSLQLVKDRDEDEFLVMRNYAMQLYMDEVLLPLTYINNIDLNEIAVIKVFRPPFFGNVSGGGGAIAFFSKKDSFSKTKTSFIVTGYSYFISTLSATPKNFWQ